MTKEILIVTDNSRGRWINRFAKRIKNGANNVSILTLGITPDYFIQSNTHRAEVISSYKFVNVDDLSEEAQRRVREFYVKFVFELPQICKKDVFFSKGENLWWFLNTTEKDPYQSKIIYRLFYLELVRQVIARSSFDEIFIDLDDYLLSETLAKWKLAEIKNISAGTFAKYWMEFCSSRPNFIYRYLRNCFGILFLFTARSAALRINRVDGVKPPRKNGIFFYTNYPFWWGDPDGDKAFEKFFGALPENLANDHPVFYATWLFSLNPVKIFFKRDFFRHFFVNKNMVLLERMLKTKDRACLLSFGCFRWALSVRRYFKTSFKAKYREFDITKFTYHEICNSLTSAGLFNNLLIKEAFRKFSECYFPQTVIYRLEFNPFERAILKGISGRCKTITFQHATLSPNLISHFFAPGEIAFHLSGDNTSLAMPLPDIIFTNGSYFHDIMINAGFPGERIHVCGPLRYSVLAHYLKQSNDKSDIRKRLGFSSSDKIFFVVLNFMEKEVMALISSLAESWKKMGCDAFFILRSHPYLKYDKKITALLRNIKPHFRYSFLKNEFSLYDAISICDAVIEVPSAVGYEAMAIGRMPIVFMNRHIFNVNSSEGLIGSTYIVDSSDELKDAMRLVLNGDEKIGHMMQGWPGVLDKFFYDLKSDPQPRFVGLLRRCRMLS